MLKPGIELPSYQTEHSAAMDVRAAIDEPIVIKPMERAFIPCGFALAIPEGYEAQIRARSGLSIKYGLCLANGVGTIDADFRGELQVLMINLGNEPYEIQPHERIAQMVISKFEKVEWVKQTELSKTDRGSGAYGSTGKI